MAKIFDAHAHYDDEKFNEDREEIIQSLKDKDVICVVNAGTDLKTSQISIDYADKYDLIYAAVGIHPEYASETPINYIEQLENMNKNKKVVAIGEIGLDYYWNKENKETQKKIFCEQIELAQKLNLPIVVHDREAHGDTMDILRKYKPKGIVHCFSGSVEMCKEVVKFGMSISLGGVVTFKNARQVVEVAEYIPLDRLLLETDAPYLAPMPFRKKGMRCDSSMIKFTAMKIAEIKGISLDELLEITKQNACKMYNIKLWIDILKC